MKFSSTVLFVPGLRDHVEDHWQTLLARRIEGARTVPPLESDKLSLRARVAALDAALQAIDGPVVLAAHSAGVLMVAHWAAHPSRPIRGALLAVPPDVETPLPEGYPKLDALQSNGWLPIPRQPLPFPSMVVASTNDPLCRFERAREFATAWGARFADAGAVGHINPAAGFGEWPRAEALLRELDP
jgi:predicted alpha/beta hydrolase family esterase